MRRKSQKKHFWSEKVWKTTKSQKTLKCIGSGGVTGFKVTTSGTSEVKNLEVTHDGPEKFLA